MDELTNRVITELSTKIGTTIQKEADRFDLKFRVFGPGEFECYVMCLRKPSGEPAKWYLRIVSSNKPNLNKFNHFKGLLEYISEYNGIIYEKEETPWYQIEFDNPVDHLFSGEDNE